MGSNRKFDPAFLNIENRISVLTLFEHDLVFFEYRYRFPGADFA